MRTPSAAPLLLLLVAATATAAGDRIVFGFSGQPGDDGVPEPWTFRRWSPVVGLGDYEAKARVVTEGGQRVLHVKSVDSGFIVGTKRRVDVTRYPHVSWRWKAERLPKGASFAARATNDQALQLLFGFEGGKVVGYIWDSTGKPGATGSGLSWREDVRVIVLQAGPARLGRWVSERRSLLEDYRKLFREDPPTLEGVAVQSNSQHTESSGAGYVGAIVLSTR